MGARNQGFRCTDALEREARASGFSLVAGVDEAGRGCLFGPVIAAAVILDPEDPIPGLQDSKTLGAGERERLATQIHERAIAWAVGGADPFEIDRWNIQQASRLAMKRAVERLVPQPNFLLTDAVTIDVPVAQQAVIHGDALCHCIAAASIVAKTERDRLLRMWDQVFPEFGLRRHKGYPTTEHKRALAAFGATALHRHTYSPVRQVSSFQQEQRIAGRIE